MMFFAFFLTISVAIAAGVSASEVQVNHVEHQVRPDCGRKCKFILCKANGRDEPTPFPPRILLRDPIAFPPFVCRKDIKLNAVLSTGEALVRPVRSKGKFTRISKFRPKGLRPPFSKNHLEVADISFPPLPGKQGIIRNEPSGTQDKFINDLCVQLPITRYQIKKGNKLREVAGKKNDCVTFVTIAPKLVIEFTWNSGDDFDMEVKEPSGFVISLSKPRSPSGRLLGDNNIGLCGSTDNGKEQVRYLRGDGFKGGKYTVKVTHANNCGKGPTDYNLYVIKEGFVIANTGGTSNKNNGKTVVNFSFTADD